MSDDDVVLLLDPGACRFKTKVIGHRDGDKVMVKLESECPYVRKTNEQLQEISLEDVVHMPMSENRIYVVSGKLLKHSVCPVPMAILKVGEVAFGLGLKRDIKAEYQK
jgi:hypothetical protein